MKRSPMSRLLRRTIENERGCLVWQGPPINTGYGRICVGGKDDLVHRVMFRLTKGEIPTGMDVDHECRNRLCINHNHLQLLERLPNLERGAHANMITRRTGICKRGHTVEGRNAMMAKDGRTRCRDCNNIRRRAYWHGRVLEPMEKPPIAEVEGNLIWRDAERG